MSLLKNLATDDTIANEKDVLGGSRVLESGVYDFKVKLAYLKPSDSGAIGLSLHLEDDNGTEFKPTIYLTSGTAKGCKNYYEKDGQKNYLPGFLIGNSLSLLTVGKELSELETEEKVVNLWNSESKAEIPTKVPMLTDLLGQYITAGIIKQVVDKNIKNDAGVYVPTGETREENEIDKLFRHKDKLTTTEIRAQVKEAAFYSAWSEKNTGKTRMKAKGAAGAGTAGVPKAAGTSGSGGASGTPGTAKPGKSLFG